MREYLPWEHLDILLDIAGFGIGKAHDDFEEALAICPRLGDCERMKSFEVATDAVLLLDGEANVHELL
jgi:hypothetical protein